MASENLNARWCEALVATLVQAGVRSAVLCPGARSAPLARALVGAPGLKTFTVVDERSAAFLALGMGLRTRQPAIVLATSGTAPANFFPAILEAEASRVPLLAITADRPWELHGFGAAQTTEQRGLFGSHVRGRVELAEPDPACFAHLRACVLKAHRASLGPVAGPVHLNVPLREPLAPVPDQAARPVMLPAVTAIAPALTVSREMIQRVGELTRRHSHGLIVCGPRRHDLGFSRAVVALGERLGYPVWAEASSGVRFIQRWSPVITCHEAIVRSEVPEGARPQVILHFGQPLTGRATAQWLSECGATTVLFSEDGVIHDPLHEATELVIGDPTSACERLMTVAPHPRRGVMLEWWNRAERAVLAELEEAFADDALTEPRVAHEVVACIPEHGQLFVSSSMPVRDVEAFATRSRGHLEVFANRGLNGIDGVTSTALGVALASATPTVLLTGDLAFLHDVSGLVSARYARASLAIVVVNNDGGGIFSFLPLADDREHFERICGTPHGMSMDHAASLAGASYGRAQTPRELRARLEAAVSDGGVHVIEVVTSRGTNVDLHQALFARLARAVEERLK